MPEPTLDKARTEACPIVMRRPVAEDGPAVSGLVGVCPPLDENSRYCNLLQCTDFSDTCIVAERAGELVGWVSGYRLPAEPETLFVWQVAVHPDARGESLGKRMLLTLLQRLSKSGVSALRTTVTKANQALACDVSLHCGQLGRGHVRAQALRSRAPLRRPARGRISHRDRAILTRRSSADPKPAVSLIFRTKGTRSVCYQSSE